MSRSAGISATPNGATVGEWTGPQIAAAYERNEMPALLPGVNGRG
jgi:hypothetical protein